MQKVFLLVLLLSLLNRHDAHIYIEGNQHVDNPDDDPCITKHSVELLTPQVAVNFGPSNAFPVYVCLIYTPPAGGKGMERCPGKPYYSAFTVWTYAGQPPYETGFQKAALLPAVEGANGVTKDCVLFPLCDIVRYHLGRPFDNVEFQGTVQAYAKFNGGSVKALITGAEFDGVVSQTFNPDQQIRHMVYSVRCHNMNCNVTPTVPDDVDALPDVYMVEDGSNAPQCVTGNTATATATVLVKSFTCKRASCTSSYTVTAANPQNT